MGRSAAGSWTRDAKLASGLRRYRWSGWAGGSSLHRCSGDSRRLAPRPTTGAICESRTKFRLSGRAVLSGYGRADRPVHLYLDPRDHFLAPANCRNAACCPASRRLPSSVMLMRRAAPDEEFVRMYRQGIPASKNCPTPRCAVTTVRYHLQIAAWTGLGLHKQHRAAKAEPTRRLTKAGKQNAAERTPAGMARGPRAWQGGRHRAVGTS